MSAAGDSPRNLGRLDWWDRAVQVNRLAGRLRARGWRVKHIAQEHSFVKDMWKRVANPEVLVFLDASYPVTKARRNLGWTESDYLEQHRRLAHARQHADLYIFTDSMSADEVEQEIIAFLKKYA